MLRWPRSLLAAFGQTWEPERFVNKGADLAQPYIPAPLTF
jgi:hypothetical protein